VFLDESFLEKCISCHKHLAGFKLQGLKLEEVANAWRWLRSLELFVLTQQFVDSLDTHVNIRKHAGVC